MVSGLEVFGHLQQALNKANFPDFNLKPKQVQSFHYLLEKKDVISVLPTGYGKSLLYQMLPDFFPCNNEQKVNIVVVISPLNSVIEDQMNTLSELGISSEVLNKSKKPRKIC